MKTVGNLLRELREEKKLLLREVAAKISIDTAVLSKIEKSKRLPTKEQIQMLGEFFESNKDEIIIAWLSDKIYYEIQNEAFALKAMQLAEERLKYMTTK